MTRTAIFHESMEAEVAGEEVMSIESLASDPGRDDCCGPQVLGMGIGRIVGFDEGMPRVLLQFEGRSWLAKAVAVTGQLTFGDTGTLVCLAFDRGELLRPIVLGPIMTDLGIDPKSGHGTQISDPNQIVLQCGKASISLKADGTVAIRGTNVASRASHTNRIRGGNIQIN